jgi:hypothetical protein
MDVLLHNLIERLSIKHILKNYMLTLGLEPE